MKKITTVIIFTLVLMLIFTLPSFADTPPDPGGGGPTGDPVGGGTPIGGGLIILALSSLVYGFRKWKLNR